MNKKIVFGLLFLGLLLIVLANANYSIFEYGKTLTEKSKEKQLDIAISSDGNQIFCHPSKHRLIDLTSLYYLKTDSGFVQTNEISLNADLLNDLFDYKDLRQKKEPRRIGTEFVQIHKTPHSTVYKLKTLKEMGLPNFWDVFYYQMNSGPNKFKVLNNAPFRIENKEIKEYKSYQIESEEESIHNSEIIYQSKDKTYKLMIQAVWTI